jgi:hypothetical protein
LISAESREQAVELWRGLDSYAANATIYEIPQPPSPMAHRWSVDRIAGAPGPFEMIGCAIEIKDREANDDD